MSSPRFLCDEDVSGTLIAALKNREPALDILCVGEDGAPPFGTKDPEVLLIAESLHRILLTNDRQSMPDHLRDHFTAGHRTHGVLLMRVGFAWSVYLDEIVMIWAASTAGEWLDQTTFIPM